MAELSNDATVFDMWLESLNNTTEVLNFKIYFKLQWVL